MKIPCLLALSFPVSALCTNKGKYPLSSEHSSLNRRVMITENKVLGSRAGFPWN